MPPESVDLRQLNHETLDLAIQEWLKLDKLVDPTHPRFREYMDLSTKAKTAYETIKLNLSIPGGLTNIDSTIESLNEMYEEALAIRGDMAVHGIRRNLGVPDGVSLESDIDRRVDAAFTGIDESRRSAIENRLLPMLYGLGVNPADVREGSAIDNFYYFPNIGAVNFEKTTAAREMVKELRVAATVAPGLNGIADTLEQGVERIEAIEPGRAAAHQYSEERNAARSIDTKPLRIVGALGAGLITIFGLSQFLINKVRGKDVGFSPAILGWAVATMALVNPKFLLQSGSSKALEEITNIGLPETRRVISGGFKNPEALAELQDLRGDAVSAKLMQEFSQLEKLNAAQVTELTGSTVSPLTQTLLAMSEDLRPRALLQFGRETMDEGTLELNQTFMRTPGI